MSYSISKNTKYNKTLKNNKEKGKIHSPLIESPAILTMNSEADEM